MSKNSRVPMIEYRELLLGCGHRRDKYLGLPGSRLEWTALTTLDNNPACEPDILCDLDKRIWVDRYKQPIALGLWDNQYDEVHAYDVLEHLGRQGDVASFFDTFWNIYGLLKPNGYFFGVTPSRYASSLWGDPGHRRVIIQDSLLFLDRDVYRKQLKSSPMSDYRDNWCGDFRIISTNDDHVRHTFCLQAIKPVRSWDIAVSK